MTQSPNPTRAYALYEGTFSVGTDKKFHRINREDPPAKGALKLALNPFLIKSGQKNILFDVGIGGFGEDTSTETIKQNLNRHHLSEFEITDVFASHLHYDHIGGLASKSSGYWELTFPEAAIWVSGKGWKKALEKELYYDEEKTKFLHYLDAKADIRFLQEEDQPYPEVKVKKIGGHTEYSQVIFYEDEGHKYLMAGDVLANRGEVNRKFAAKYDYDAKQSMARRQELTRQAWEEGYTVMGYHETHHPLFKLSNYNQQQGYKIQPL